MEVGDVFKGCRGHLTQPCRYENLTSNPLKYRPAVNQVELSFGNPQPELLAVRILIELCSSLIFNGTM